MRTLIDLFVICVITWLGMTNPSLPSVAAVVSAFCLAFSDMPYRDRFVFLLGIIAVAASVDAWLFGTYGRLI